MTGFCIDGALLAIETAGSLCSAAVVQDGRVLAVDRRPLRHGHAEAVMPMVRDVVARAGLRPSGLAAIAASVGPGGFTGIRVGLAAALGIAVAARIRSVGVTSFAAVAAKLPPGAVGQGGKLLVALDSRRAELYVQLFGDDAQNPLTSPASVPPHELAKHIRATVGETRLVIAGDAAALAAAALHDWRAASVAPASAPDALGVAAAAQRALRSGAAEMPLRPLYIRSPDVTLPKLGPGAPAPLVP